MTEIIIKSEDYKRIEEKYGASEALRKLFKDIGSKGKITPTFNEQSNQTAIQVEDIHIISTISTATGCHHLEKILKGEGRDLSSMKSDLLHNIISPVITDDETDGIITNKKIYIGKNRSSPTAIIKVI